ncbi:hypothetical protein J7E25_08185 [Agromyces sp. ISL-38]|uniref:hypothetical protein n=1 Tax=Agromyces sp. ISL-38 TaxID=2819107 RepID=UPI001BE7F78B|nr:hypothetical protein [Agromyces sp. ISL-38]MBT2499073.1 hypothetical protein [Agromyces sp. ISL-38]
MFDGATDPIVIRHRETGEWWMFTTQRRTRDALGGKMPHDQRFVSLRALLEALDITN